MMTYDERNKMQNNLSLCYKAGAEGYESHRANNMKLKMDFFHLKAIIIIRKSYWGNIVGIVT